jgi:acetyl esterase/lipase
LWWREQMGSAHPNDTLSNLVRGLIAQAARHPSRPFRRVLSVDYRLCRTAPLSKPANPFPSALFDALAAYQYLVRNLHFQPKDIIISGDSAGGNLALALTRYLRDARVPDLVIGPPEEGPCGGLMVQSPWCDMTSTHKDVWLGSVQRNRLSDIVTRDKAAMSVYGLAGFRGDAIPEGEVARSPYMSPGSLKLGEPPSEGSQETSTKGIFINYPRCYFTVGGRELLLDEVRLTAQRIEADSSGPSSKSLNAPADGSDDAIGKDRRLLGAEEAKLPTTKSETDSGATAVSPAPPPPWVTVSEESDMVHDFCVFAVCEPARSRELAKMVDWIAHLP